MAAAVKATNFSCFVDGYAIEDIWDFADNLDETRCILTNIVYTISKTRIFYLYFLLLLLIIVISIFGKIQGTYRWFILNQAIWDFYICYNSVCSFSVNYILPPNAMEDSFCILYPSNNNQLLNYFGGLTTFNPYASLFLLSFTRFICLYFNNFYKKLTKNGRRIFVLIFGFNFTIIFLHIYGPLDDIRLDALNVCISENLNKNANYDYCYANFNQSFYGKFVEIIEPILSDIVSLKSFIFLLLSFLSTFLITFKLLKQAKFQYKSNKKQFLNSFRIFAVILAQTLINFAVFFIETAQDLPTLLGFFGINYFKVIKLPAWIGANFGLVDRPFRATIIQFRIFVEAVIVLTIMTGYREAIINAFKFVQKRFFKSRRISRINGQLLLRKISSN